MRKILKALGLLLLLLLIAAAGCAVWFYRELRVPVAHAQAGQYIEIPRGSTPAEAINRIAAAGVIRRGWPLLAYIRFTGDGPRLKAGEYRFPSPVSPLEVLQKLLEGEQRLSRFTVIEGWTRWDIAEAMARIPELGLANADAALALMNDTSEIRDLDPRAENLEGYLYPDTYNFPPSTTPREMISAMVRRYRQVWQGEFAAPAQAAGRNMRELVTVASLIETEAKLAEEREIVASVIYNRLRLNMPLGIDSTIVYASKLAGRWRGDGRVYQSDIDRDSPYNTRRVRGLPPGPVAAPSARSLRAALNPAQTNYLYYVREPSRDDGAHNFYENESDFQQGVQALRDWERERDRRAAQNQNSQ